MSAIEDLVDELQRSYAEAQELMSDQHTSFPPLSSVILTNSTAAD